LRYSAEKESGAFSPKPQFPSIKFVFGSRGTSHEYQASSINSPFTTHQLPVTIYQLLFTSYHFLIDFLPLRGKQKKINHLCRGVQKSGLKSTNFCSFLLKKRAFFEIFANFCSFLPLFSKLPAFLIELFPYPNSVTRPS